MADILKKIDEDKEKSTALEDAFKSCRHPDTLSMSFLAADIGVTQEEIEVKLKHFLFFFSFHILRNRETAILRIFKSHIEEIALSKP